MQEAAIAAMQAALVKDGLALAGHDDRITCARFLKARRWEVPRALTMYADMAAFRRERRLDDPEHSFAFPEHDQARG